MPFALSWQNWATFSIEVYVELHNWFWKSQCTCHQNVTQSVISRSISHGSLYRRSLAFASLYFFRSPFTWRDLHTVGWVMRQTEYKIKTLTIKNELIFMPVQACGVSILHSEKTKHYFENEISFATWGERILYHFVLSCSKFWRTTFY